MINRSVTTGSTTTVAFQEVVEQALQIVTDAVANDWKQVQALDDLPDAVYIKNSEGVLVEVNHVYRDTFCPHGSPVGRLGTAFLDKLTIDVSIHTDSLILNGSNHLECEHTGRDAAGQFWLLRTHKRSLASLGDPGLAILGITRRLHPLEDATAHPRMQLAEQHLRFRELDETDRVICQQLASGSKVREIADSLGLTSRAVEQRKRKILEALKLEQTLDLVKLLVRLQDSGFVDLGL